MIVVCRVEADANIAEEERVDDEVDYHECVPVTRQRLDLRMPSTQYAQVLPMDTKHLVH